MKIGGHQYSPDYAVSPGSVLEEELEARGISQAEFARRCGRSAKLISEIIAGKAPVEPLTAIQFEQVLGVEASLWLGIESNYRLRLAQMAEAIKWAESVSWARTFPINELTTRNAIPKPVSDQDAVSKLLSFFGVGSVDAWKVKYASANVAYRHSPAFRSDEAILATWLRLGEIKADETNCPDYNEATFRRNLGQIRGLTRGPFLDSLGKAQGICRESGVVLSVVKPLPRAAISGAAWWVSARKAMIQLSARHLTDDHLWFSFFHEAAHLVLHSKKNVSIDAIRDKGQDDHITDADVEADTWAEDFLVPRSDWERFVASSPRAERAVRQFADRQGIAPGLVVGRLQYEGHLAWRKLNFLKTRLRWP